MADDLSSSFLSLQVLGLLIIVGYVYLAAVLSVLARKTATDGAWMAWVPILNLILMCRIGRQSGWLVLLLLVPLVNIIVLVWLWMAIARVRGRAPMLGLLMVIPLVNLFIPLILASGPPSNAGVGRTSSGPAAAPSSASPSVCPACGRTECVGEEFCGFTGQRIGLSTASLISTPPSATAQQGPGMLAKAILGVLLVLGAGYFVFGLVFSGGSMLSGSARSTPALPPRIAGTLTEFPVDTAATPVRPTAVVTQNLRTASNAAPTKLPPNSLPSGLAEPQLSQIADSMTTATYQARPADAPVNVHVMNAPQGTGPQGQRIAATVAGAQGGEMSGIRVDSPSGAQYSGYRIRTAGTVTYVIEKAGANIVIIIYAPDPSVISVADRLTANVGNGNGLNDDPDVSSSLAALPAQLPDGVELVGTNTYSGASLQGSMDQFKNSVGNDSGPDANQWVNQVQQYMPAQVTTSQYLDPTKRPLNMAVGNYGEAWKSWVFWQVLRATLSFAGMRSVPMAGGDALSIADQGTEYVLFRRGASLGLIGGAVGQTALSVRLAESIQP